jgi:hypothetical protein
MARLTLQLGGSLVVPITAARRLPADWRLQALVEAGLSASARHRSRRDNGWGLAEPTALGVIAAKHVQAQGALR